MTAEKTDTPERIQHGVKLKVVICVAAALLVVSVATASYFYLQYQNLKGNSAETSEQKTDRLVKKIGKIYALPNETPTVAAITDKEKLQGQTFFKDAENGDQLLIFPKAKLAILYRESDNKLINVGPVEMPDDGMTDGGKK